MVVGSNVQVPAGPYLIVDVARRPPALLTDFLGASTITVAVDGESRRLDGMCGLTAQGMEFEQKDPDADGAEIRVWAITEGLQQTFWAAPLTVTRR